MLGFGRIPAPRSCDHTGLQLCTSYFQPWGCSGSFWGWGQLAEGPDTLRFGVGRSGVASGGVTALALPQGRSQLPYLLPPEHLSVR